MDYSSLGRTGMQVRPYSMVYRGMERDMVPMAKAHEIALITWSPLWGGLLTGKYRREKPMPADARFGFDPLRGIWDSDVEERVYTLLDLLDTMAAEKQCTVSQLALAWVMAQHSVTSAIIGPRTLPQLQDNLGAMEVSITDEDRRRIDEIAQSGAALARLPG